MRINHRAILKSKPDVIISEDRDFIYNRNPKIRQNRILPQQRAKKGIQLLNKNLHYSVEKNQSILKKKALAGKRCHKLKDMSKLNELPSSSFAQILGRELPLRTGYFRLLLIWEHHRHYIVETTPEIL